MRWPAAGPTAPSSRSTSPSTTLPAAAPDASERRNGRSKPRSFAPRISSPKGISDCSIEVANTTSKPATLAPPSSTAVSTRPTSVVQVDVGEWSKGGVLCVSSSIAITATGALAASRRAPNICQRSAVRISIDQPWICLNDGCAVISPHSKATSKTATASRLTSLMRGFGPGASSAYCSVTRRPITGPAPALASASTTKATCFDFSVMA